MPALGASRVPTTGWRRQRAWRRSRAFGPRHDRQAPPFGGQQAVRRQSRPLSGSLRAFQSRGGTPGTPDKSEKTPAAAVFRVAGPAASRHARTSAHDTGAPPATWFPPEHHLASFHRSEIPQPVRPIRRRQHTTLEAICPTSRDRSDPLLTARQIDSKKPPRYTAQHRVGLLPGGFLFPE